MCLGERVLHGRVHQRVWSTSTVQDECWSVAFSFCHEALDVCQRWFLWSFSFESFLSISENAILFHWVTVAEFSGVTGVTEFSGDRAPVLYPFLIPVIVLSVVKLEVSAENSGSVSVEVMWAAYDFQRDWRLWRICLGTRSL